MNDNIYNSPESKIEVDSKEEPKAGLVLVAFMLLFTFLSCAVSFSSSFYKSGNVAASVGGALAPMLLGLIIVGLFQVAKSRRNQRSRYKVFLICQIIFLFSGTFGLLATIGQSLPPQ